MMKGRTNKKRILVRIEKHEGKLKKNENKKRKLKRLLEKKGLP